jgi:hypothetical protein
MARLIGVRRDLAAADPAHRTKKKARTIWGKVGHEFQPLTQHFAAVEEA